MRGRRWCRWLAALTAMLALGSATEVRGADDEPAEEEARPRQAGGADLRRCLELADRNHPNVRTARAKLDQVRAQLDEAHFAPFSNFRATGGVALAPTVRGNNVYSPNTDASLTASLGMAWRVGVEGVVPLWTFGKITNLWDAAEANVKVKEAEIEVARDEVRFDVRKAYLGLQLARDGLYLLEQAQSRLEEAVDRLERDVEEDEADPIDLAKLQTFAAELGARRAEAERYQRIARAGLRFYTGADNLEPRDEPLRKAPHRLRELTRYVDAARAYRPEVAMARAGLEAREAQVRLSRSQLFPDLGLSLAVGYSSAPEITNQINPFTYDQANYIHYGAALVFQWKLDFLPAVARIAFAEAQLQEVLAQSVQARSGVAAQVEEAYAEVVDWDKRLQAYSLASRHAKTWLAQVQQAISAGTLEEDQLLDPAKAWADQRYNVLNATMEYNLALSKLAKVTGWDAIAPGG
jgi:outer membrane protein TolC